MTMRADVTGGRLVKLRDGTPVLVPVVARFEPHEPSPDWPAVELEVDVDETGRPVVTRVSLIGALDRPIQSNAVRSYSLERLTSLALSDVVLRVAPPGEQAGGLKLNIGDGNDYVFDQSETVWQRAVVAVRQRTSVGRDRLADVARLYTAGGVKAIEENLVISRSQAYRLVAQARKEGMIES
jgi:hypothetical protein